MVSIEDARFYEHSGVDFQGIGRALVKDILSMSAAQGGSTITQQFVKNALEAQGDRSLFVKFKEAALAYRLERHWSKDKILTEYLNTVYFGEGAYGIEAAARTYFGDAHPGCGTRPSPAPRCWSPGRRRCWPAIIQSPSAYDPKVYPENALVRRNLVLERMAEQGYISEEQLRRRQQSRRCPRRTRSNRPTLDSKAPYFTAYLRQQLVERYGASKAFFGGLKVKSTLDLRLQEAAEEAVNSYLGYSPATASVVVIDNHNAGIKAMVGGPDFDTRPFNLATQGHRQPGSSIKPFTLLDRARTGNLAGTTVYESAPQDFHFGKNGAGNLRGHQRRGLLPRLLLDHLRDDQLRQLGLRPARARRPEGQDDPRPHPLDRRAPPTRGLQRPDLDQPGDGARRPRPRRHPARLDLRLQHDRQRRRPGQRHPGAAPRRQPRLLHRRSPTRTTRRSRAATTTPPTSRCSTRTPPKKRSGILETVVSSGTGTNAQIGAEGQWGKTGTTEDNGDAWFCGGISDEATACVWVGYPDSTTPMTTLYNGGPVMGGTFPALIWASVMSAWEEIKAERRGRREARKDGAKRERGRRNRDLRAPNPTEYEACRRKSKNYEPAPEPKPRRKPKPHPKQRRSSPRSRTRTGGGGGGAAGQRRPA